MPVIKALLLLSLSSSTAFAATTAPVVKYLYDVPYSTAIEAEYAFYQAWIRAYGKVNCGFSQLTWIEKPTQVNGYVPFSDACGYGHILPVVLPKIVVCPVATPPYVLSQDKLICTQEEVCPVDPLPTLPTGDLCAQSLENGAGKDVDNACPDLTDEMKKQAQCLYDKIWKISPPISYSKPSAAIRNEAYQNHLVDVWNKLKEIENKDLTDAQEQACAAVIAHAERHGIDSPPSQSGNEAPHVKGRAIDIPKDTAKALMRQVATFITIPKPPGCLPCNDVITVIGDVQDYVNSATENPPACNLRWGGRFTPIDRVHFQLP